MKKEFEYSGHRFTILKNAPYWLNGRSMHRVMFINHSCAEKSVCEDVAEEELLAHVDALESGARRWAGEAPILLVAALKTKGFA